MKAGLQSSSNEYDSVAFATLDENDIELDDLEFGELEVDDGPKTLAHTLEEGISILQVTIRRPFTLLSILAILWGLIPYMVSILASVAFLHQLVLSILDNRLPITGHCGFLMFFLVLAISGVLLNEKYLKKKFKEFRPPESASHGYGMPSGHCTNSYAWMMWWLLEIVIHPSKTGLVTDWVLASSAMALLGPVPVARVYVGDHTFRQAFAGCVVGTVLGIVAVFLRWLLFTHAIPLWIPVY